MGSEMCIRDRTLTLLAADLEDVGHDGDQDDPGEEQDGDGGDARLHVIPAQGVCDGGLGERGDGADGDVDGAGVKI